VHHSNYGKPPDLEGADPVPPPSLSGFAPDTPEGKDFLDLDDEVYSLATLICSRDISPPLSIGLFGDWGSGKTFFMQQIKSGVEWVADQSRRSGRMQKDIPFYKHVVQIEFNAWQYSEGNLWASLVQHILDNLRVSAAEEESYLQKRKSHLQQRMELEKAAQQAAQTQEQQAQQVLTAAKQQLDDLKQEHEREIRKLRRVLARDVMATIELPPEFYDDLNKLRVSLGLPELSRSAQDFLAAVDDTRTVLRRGILAVFPAFGPAGKRYALGVVAVVALPILVAVALGIATRSLDGAIPQISAASGWLSTVLGGAALWLRRQSTILNQSISKVEELRSQVEQRVEEAKAQQSAEVAEIEKRIALAVQEISQAQQRQQEAAQRVQEIQAQLDQTTAASVLADFIQERTESQEYRRHLGLLAVIRRDFDEISKMIAQENHDLDNLNSLEQESLNEEERINRIVLYIDGLDRCPESRVVEVLQAVHLLLSFPLFVAVVAVDARWVSQSLAKKYPGLLTPDGKDWAAGYGSGNAETANPYDYLEKIFQIPYWVKPLNEASVRRMVQGLVVLNRPTEANPDVLVDVVVPPGNDHQPVAPREPQARWRYGEAVKALELVQPEVEFMEQLTPLLERTPRAVKRFVNVYRLIKASLTPAEQDGFLDHPTSMGQPFQIVLLLLGIITGLPNIAPLFLNRLMEAENQQRVNGPVQTTLEEVVKSLLHNNEVVPERYRLEAWLDQHFPGSWQGADPALLAAWTPRVARHSFQLLRA
jgi:hypothetical protein